MKTSTNIAAVAAFLLLAGMVTGCGMGEGDPNAGINKEPQPTSAGRLPTPESIAANNANGGSSSRSNQSSFSR